MNIEVANSLVYFIRNLESHHHYVIYTDETLKSLFDSLRKFKESGFILEFEIEQLRLFFNSINKGDLGDRCASYYYNLNDRRINSLYRLIFECLKEEDRLDFCKKILNF